MRGGAAERRLDAEMRRRSHDHLSDRRRVVEHEAEVRVQRRGVECARALERELLADREQQLELDRRAVARGLAHEREYHRYGGLVIRAEDPVVGVFIYAVHEHGVDGRLRGNGVEVRA